MCSTTLRQESKMDYTELMDMIDIGQVLSSRHKSIYHLDFIWRMLRFRLITLEDLDALMVGLPARDAAALRMRVAGFEENREPSYAEIGRTISPPLQSTQAQTIVKKTAKEVYVRLRYLTEIYCGELNIEWTKLQGDYIGMDIAWTNDALLNRAQSEGQKLPRRQLERKLKLLTPAEAFTDISDAEFRQEFVYGPSDIRRLKTDIAEGFYPLWVTSLLPEHFWNEEAA
jgi:hypothetical protein